MPLNLRLLVMLSLCACTIPDDTSRHFSEAPTVARARTALLGLDEADIRMCAGFPTQIADMGERGLIWSYQRATPRGNVSVSIPTVATGSLGAGSGALGLPSSGSCSAQMRFSEGRVVQVEYSGDNNSPSRLNSLCASLVDSCVVYADQRNAPGE